MREIPIIFGVLGDYVVDETPSFGLFIRLKDWAVFVDIRRDRLENARRARAQFLYQQEAQLNLQLDLFLKANPEFAARSIGYIGLHSKNIEQGEVFWDPDGYTLLKGTTFSA